MNQTQQIQINDIKDIVEIPDYSIYIFIAICIAAFIVIGLIIYFIYKYFSNKKYNKNKEYFAILKSLDLNNTKHSAYMITKYGTLLAKNPREKRLISSLNSQLEQYKYKKDVKPFDDDIKNQFDIFLDSLDV
jgi:hypothetical protein